jgi:hypothetical protein
MLISEIHTGRIQYLLRLLLMGLVYLQRLQIFEILKRVAKTFKVFKSIFVTANSTILRLGKGLIP